MTLVWMLPGPTSAEAGRRPQLIDSYGLWTFKRLGYESVELVPKPGADRVRSDSVPVTYRLPPDAHQGSDTWYLIQLRFRAVLATGSGNGFAVLKGNTNARGAAQITFERERGRTYWSSVSIIDGGQRRKLVRSRVIDGAYVNVLQYRGVHPGTNVLELRLDQFPRIQFERIIFDTTQSGIELSRRGPASLAIDLDVADSSIRKGDTFEVEYRARNTGGRRAENVTARVELSDRGLVPVGPSQARLGSLRPHQQRDGTFRLRARETGAHPVTIFLSSSAGGPAKMIRVTVEEAGVSGLAGRTPWWVWAVLAFAAVGLAVALVDAFRRRWRGSARARRLGAG